jgi:DNA-binding PadR family transcriptional regulator
MSLRHAILGVLKEGPLHGYGVADELERRIAGGRYNSAQVYQGLRWLADGGFVSAAVPEPAVGRDRRPFHITSRGTREFDRWLRSPFVPARPTRDDAIVKLAFLSRAELSQLVVFLERLKRQHIRSLASTRPSSRKSREDGAPKLSVELTAMALRFRAEAELRWIDYCLLRLGAVIGDRVGAPSEASAGPAPNAQQVAADERGGRGRLPGPADGA